MSYFEVYSGSHFRPIGAFWDLLERWSFLFFRASIDYYLHQEGASVYDTSTMTEQAERAIAMPGVSNNELGTLTCSSSIEGASRFVASATLCCLLVVAISFQCLAVDCSNDDQTKPLKAIRVASPVSKNIFCGSIKASAVVEGYRADGDITPPVPTSTVLNQGRFPRSQIESVIKRAC